MEACHFYPLPMSAPTSLEGSCLTFSSPESSHLHSLDYLRVENHKQTHNSLVSACDPVLGSAHPCMQRLLSRVTSFRGRLGIRRDLWKARLMKQVSCFIWFANQKIHDHLSAISQCNISTSFDQLKETDYLFP
jgi:hypothetical protein